MGAHSAAPRGHRRLRLRHWMIHRLSGWFGNCSAHIPRLPNSWAGSPNVPRAIRSSLEEIVRDLADRGVLSGDRGAYTCADEVTDVEVPATLQAAISARIDRLAPSAKLTLNAAAVIGLRFEATLLAGTGRPRRSRAAGRGGSHRPGGVHAGAPSTRFGIR